MPHPSLLYDREPFEPRRDLSRCGYLGCDAPATWRGRTVVPDEPIARCDAHYGHHDFTERLSHGLWEVIDPWSDESLTGTADSSDQTRKA